MIPRASVVLLVAVGLGACSQPASEEVTSADQGMSSREALDEGFRRLALEHRYARRVLDVPTRGEAARTPWADTNWPEQQGGLAWRWNDPAFVQARPGPGSRLPYTPPSEAHVRGMTRAELAKLSPAEKYDVFVGDFRYATTRYMLEGREDDTPWWAGICGGWSSAALEYPEPAPRDVTGPSGITVPFGSSDIKALLAYYHETGFIPGLLGVEKLFDVGGDFEGAQRIHAERVMAVGDDCSNDECEHPTAAEFHAVVGNELGVRKRGFVVDVRADERTYYQPAFRYESRVVEQGTADVSGAAARRVRFRTTLETASDIADVRADEARGTPPSWEPRLASGRNVTATHEYEYEIVVAEDGTVVSSRWLSTERPDSVFVRDVPAGFVGHLRGLTQIMAGER